MVFMMEGYREYLENEGSVIAEAGKLAADIAEYELWAEEQAKTTTA
jgi:hypothetical protein